MTTETVPPPEFISDVTQQSANPQPQSTVSPSLKIYSASNNGVAEEMLDEMPLSPHFKVLDSKDYADKYRKYESECTQLLMSKYFSGKNIYGGNIFEEKTDIGDEIIMSSRWPCTRSYADPVKCFQEQIDEGPVPDEKNQCKIPNGDLATEKSS